MRNLLPCAIIGVAACLGAPAGPLVSAQPLKVRLVSNLASPQPFGTPIGLLPRLENRKRSTYVFRYRVSLNGGPFHIIRDFAQEPSFVWTSELYEHEASIRVTARDNASKEMAEADLPFKVTSRVRNQKAVVAPTANPIVALFSAPACAEGMRFRVAFQRMAETAMIHTDAKPCRGSVSQGVYVAGMRSDSDYRMRLEVIKGERVKTGETTGEWIPFHTGLLDGAFPPVSVATPRAGTAVSEPLIIRSLLEPWRSMATDQDGNVVWFLQHQTFLTRVLPGGRFLALGDGSNSVNDMRRLQVVQEIDLAGNIIRETNIGRVAEQLATRGIASDCKKGAEQCVPGFHHEAIRLKNGHTIVLAGLERMFQAGTQGAKERVDILGDLIVDLDEDLQVAWVWNSFDHMDMKRASLGDEKCNGGAGGDGCTPVFLAASANGWLHSNSLNYIPSTGDLLMSIPEQDWVVKIDFKNGGGSGAVLWRLGADGDFTVKSDDPYPWFSYQHDAGFEPVGSNLISLLDDGHRRKDKYPNSHNRGQVWKIDEDTKTASLVQNADLGVYSVAVGSAQTLSNGGYSFEAGFINPPAMYSRTVETSADGKVTYAQQVEGSLTYRSFRVADMYSAPPK